MDSVLLEQIHFLFYFRANVKIEELDAYNVWCASITEVEVDMLTGEKNLVR